VQNKVRIKIECFKFALGVNMLKVRKRYEDAKKESL